MAKTRGLETQHEQKSHQLLRDTRTLSERFFAFIRNPESGAIILAITAVVCIVYSQLADLLLILGSIVFVMCLTNKSQLPYRLPQRSKTLDYNDPKPGSGKPYLARGICYFGNDILNNQELWFNNDDMRTHVLIFGSTGSGKTETLVSLSYNALLQGSGFIYVDGKGDTSLYAKLFSLCRSMGREDDLLIVNFMTGARDIVGPQKGRISNTMNPFSRGSSSMLTNLVVSMMGESAQGGDGDMWKGRAIAFVEALMKILVYMRDLGDLLLDAHSIRLYFSLPKLESIALDKKFPLPNDRLVDISNAPEVVIQPIANYLDTLPGFNKTKKGNQAGEVLEQHGFITMQLTRSFSSLADTYGHIIRSNLPEVDFRDVILNRRILCVLLPALEKSPEELSNLGKIIVASLKGMMASGLGEAVEGTYQEVIERKITNSPTPFLCILDEYGYYAVKGFAVVPAQARSLGFSAIFAGQDLPAFEKGGKEEAASIGANTNIKICMKLEDPKDTFEFFQKTAGQAYVTQTSGFQANASSMTNSYADSKNTQVEKRDRIDLLDLKDQGMGEAHIFFKSRLVRARMFFANPKPAPNMKINQFLKVEPPPEEMIQELSNRLVQFESVITNPIILEDVAPLDEELMYLRTQIDENTAVRSPLKRVIAAVSAYYQKENVVEQEAFFEETPEVAEEGVMDICTQPPMAFPDLEDFDPLRFLTMPALIGPLLDKRDARRYAESIERFAGKTRAEAVEVSAKIISDMRTATRYPLDFLPQHSPEETIQAIRALVAHFRALREPAGDNSSSGVDENNQGDDNPLF